MKKVTGVGGIFFKAQDPGKLKSWYDEHLGFNTDQYGAMFKTRQAEDPSKSSYLQWSVFDRSSTHMDPSEKPFMINYRVANIEQLVDELKQSGVNVLDEIESYDYGKFVHLMDPEGNKIELWEPVDEVFDEYEAKKNQ